MPVGEIIGEVILRTIIEGLSYLTGFIILKGITLGAIRLAPLSTMHHKNPGKKRWYQIDWSIWLERPGRGGLLKADVVCIVGLLAWGLAGMGIYMEHRGKSAEEESSTGNRLSPGICRS